ncbi:hypothetical protein BJD99_19095 [Rhodococcus sp. 1163]|uniref:helix-turn-helix transcriptional regulator n=1 Tax=Rhodococcus sp. 1163 TaxID=1905289 RepID=UPI0009FF808F|nr:helix-turn-helix transcriptional regulator [Rhodococcus sp. 1163]ORI18850.1 hypothetical protein BJD99_19095 [Rhodococcus sp. 1163]
MDNMNAKIGRTIAALRVAKSMSQADLAEAVTKLGDSFQQQTILKVEKGSRPLKLTEALNFAEALGVLPAVLWRGIKDTDATTSISHSTTRIQGLVIELTRAASTLQTGLINLATDLAVAGEDVAQFAVDNAVGYLQADYSQVVAQTMREVLRAEYGNLPEDFTVDTIRTESRPSIPGEDDADD